MIKINFAEPDTPEWRNWKVRCNAARQQLIVGMSNGILPSITNLYKEQKAALFAQDRNYYGKCAYCETLITANQPGDVEHYRPKGRITDSSNRRVLIKDAAGVDVPHPGYYWLAYDFANLLPGCMDCNRPSSGNSGGVLIGKWDQFPVNGMHATNPGEEMQEDPLIINPINDDPENHLEIDNLGLLNHKTAKGEMTIKTLGLNLRQGLVEERKRTYDAVKNSARLFLIALAMRADGSQHFDEMQKHKNGMRPYAIAGRKALKDFKNESKDIVDFLNT
jgi:hypothetical protein